MLSSFKDAHVLKGAGDAFLGLPQTESLFAFVFPNTDNEAPNVEEGREQKARHFATAGVEQMTVCFHY